jgi:vitamin B12 transporter
LGSTYFHTHLKNLIDWTASGYINSGKARIYGIENFLEYPINENTSLIISYTHMDTKDLTNQTRLLRRPNNKLTCKLKTAFDKWDIKADLSYVGNRADTSGVKLKAYILGNLAFKYTVNERLNIFLRLENIFDRDYELVNGYQTPKFSWYLSAKLNF